MTFETAIFRPLLLPLFIRGEDEEPRKVHWVGRKAPAPINSDGRYPGHPPERKTKRGYRNLATITLGEVHEAFTLFASQLVPSPHPSWIAPNYFCMIELTQNIDDRPSAVFGRVRYCYPGDGHIQNIQEMELSFPRKVGAPEVVHLRSRDVSGGVQSYCLRVRLFGTPEDIADFSDLQDQFNHQGYVLEFQTNFLDLLELDVQDREAMAEVHILSSRWFNSLPDTMLPEIREKLTQIVYRNPLVFNYHPEHLPPTIRTLNRELHLKAGFSETFLLEPETPEQSLQIIHKQFDAYFVHQR